MQDGRFSLNRAARVVFPRGFKRRVPHDPLNDPLGYISVDQSFGT